MDLLITSKKKKILKFNYIVPNLKIFSISIA